jgi:hypothetical protein
MLQHAVGCWLLVFGVVTSCGCAETALDEPPCSRLPAFGPKDSLNTANLTVRNKDLSVRVGVREPTFQVRLEPDPTSTLTPDVDSRVGWIRIFSCRTDALVQSLEVTGRGGPESFLRFFEVKDLNFDGYLDLGVQREFGAKWERQTWWVFDPRSERFVSNDLTRALGDISSNGLELDGAKHNILAGHMGDPVCGGTQDIYHVEDGRRLVLMHQETIDPDADGGCTLTTRDRTAGQMQVTSVRRNR